MKKVVFGLGGFVTIISIFLICRQHHGSHDPREVREYTTVSTNSVAISYGLIAGVMGGYSFLSMKLVLLCNGTDCTIKHVFIWLLLLWSGTSEVVLVCSLNIGMSTLKYSR